MLVSTEVKDGRQQSALEDVLAERRFQDDQFGEQNHDLAWWYVILGEEFGEVGKALCNWRWADRVGGTSTITDIRKEAVQVAAVALAIIECIDRGEWVNQITTAVPSDRRQLSMALNRSDESIHAKMSDDEDDTEFMPSREQAEALGLAMLKKFHPTLAAELEADDEQRS